MMRISLQYGVCHPLSFYARTSPKGSVLQQDALTSRNPQISQGGQSTVHMLADKLNRKTLLLWGVHMGLTPYHPLEDATGCLIAAPLFGRYSSVLPLPATTEVHTVCEQCPVRTPTM